MNDMLNNDNTCNNTCDNEYQSDIDKNDTITNTFSPFNYYIQHEM